MESTEIVFYLAGGKALRKKELCSGIIGIGQAITMG
jgi:hypothetical protein